MSDLLDNRVTEAVPGEDVPTTELTKEFATDEEEDDAATGHYFVRFGTFMLSLPRPDLDREEVYNWIVQALKADSRVQNVEAEPFRAAWSHVRKMYPPKVQLTTNC